MENKKIYELVGIITAKEKDKARVGTKYEGQEYWRLQTVIEHQEEVKEILAYKDLVSKEVWQQITNRKYHGKKYIFLCWKVFKSYWLVDWKIINGSN